MHLKQDFILLKLVSRVENKWGPQSKPKSNLHNELLDLTDSFKRQVMNNGIEERLRNMESHLKLKSGVTFSVSWCEKFSIIN